MSCIPHLGLLLWAQSWSLQGTKHLLYLLILHVLVEGDNSLWRHHGASEPAQCQSKSQQHPARARGWEQRSGRISEGLDPNGNQESLGFGHHPFWEFKPKVKAGAQLLTHWTQLREPGAWFAPAQGSGTTLTGLTGGEWMDPLHDALKGAGWEGSASHGTVLPCRGIWSCSQCIVRAELMRGGGSAPASSIPSCSNTVQ